MHSTISGIAGDQRQGQIYAMVTPCTGGTGGSAEVYARRATGNSAPLRSFTDATTRFRDVMGIAFSPVRG